MKRELRGRDRERDERRETERERDIITAKSPTVEWTPVAGAQNSPVDTLDEICSQRQ